MKERLKIIVNFFLKELNIFILYRFGNAIGDQLCMTAIVENIYDNYSKKIIIFSSYPEFFENNPKIWKSYSIKKQNRYIAKLISRLLSALRGGEIENFCFPYSNGGGLEVYMRNSKAKISLIEAHSLHFKRKLALKEAKPKIYFSEKELKIFQEKFKDLPKNFAIIQPIGKTTYTPNKEWSFIKFQNVIKNLTEIKWLQTGFSNDLLLNDVIDFRGKTNTLRELAYIVSKADFVLCLEGLLNHIAASVNTKSFVIFSGFSQIELAKYITTIPIVKTPQVECSPCWILEKCPKEKKWCTENILVQDVVDVIRKEVL